MLSSSLNTLPALISTLPPTPDIPWPTESVIPPPEPLFDAPVLKTIAPLDPPLDVPVANVIEPLPPDTPLFGAMMPILPE